MSATDGDLSSPMPGKRWRLRRPAVKKAQRRFRRRRDLPMIGLMISLVLVATSCISVALYGITSVRRTQNTLYDRCLASVARDAAARAAVAGDIEGIKGDIALVGSLLAQSQSTPRNPNPVAAAYIARYEKIMSDGVASKKASLAKKEAQLKVAPVTNCEAYKP